MPKLILLLLFFLPLNLHAYREYEIKSVEAMGFTIGTDNTLGGNFSYMIDRTNKLCYATNIRKGVTNSMLPIPCKSLMNTPEIKAYYDTGKVPK